MRPAPLPSRRAIPKPSRAGWLRAAPAIECTTTQAEPPPSSRGGTARRVGTAPPAAGSTLGPRPRSPRASRSRTCRINPTRRRKRRIRRRSQARQAAAGRRREAAAASSRLAGGRLNLLCSYMRTLRSRRHWFPRTTEGWCGLTERCLAARTGQGELRWAEERPRFTSYRAVPGSPGRTARQQARRLQGSDRAPARCPPAQRPADLPAAGRGRLRRRPTIVEDCVHRIWPCRQPAFLELDFRPGECAQVDWG